MVDPRPHDLAAAYDRIAGQYADTYADELDRKPFDRELLDRFAGIVRGRVAEIGCGPGHVGRYLAARGAHVVGLDLSAGMLATAQRLDRGRAFVQADLRALPLRTAAFGAVVMFYLVHHLPRTALVPAVAEAARALAPGGRLLIAFHCGEGALHATEWFGVPVDLEATLFGRDEMARALREAGLAVDEVVTRPPYESEYKTERGYALATRALRR